MRERDLLELERRALRRQLRPGHPSRRRFGAEIREHDRCSERGEGAHDLRELAGAVEVFAAVAVAVRREERGGIELREAIDDGARPEGGRARGPGGTEARRGEEGD